MESQDQLSRVTDVDTTPPEGVSNDADAPIMPFPTSYVLTREQEAELVEHAKRRMAQLEEENGRSRGAHTDWWDSGSESAEDIDPLNRDRMDRTWLGKRRLYDLTYDNHVDFRVWTQGGIYKESNLTVPISRRVCRQMIARAINYFFGSDPWFAAFPVGEMDRGFAQRCDRYARWKMDKAGLRRTLEKAIERAFVVGEAVVKSTWRKDVQYYKSTEAVLVGEDGKPVIDLTGDYITEDDVWVSPMIEDPDTPGQMMENTGQVLKRDMSTPRPANPVFEKRLLTRRIKLYEGNHAAVIHYGDFLCPLTAPTIQEADCIIHLYDRPVMDIVDEWRRDQEEGDVPEESVENIRKALDLIKDMAQSGTTANTAQEADRPDEDTSSDRAAKEPKANIAEFHMRYDANGDGIMEEIFLMLDTNTDKPIFYDYEANVTPDGLRPFSVVRVNEITNRWYGMGAMEMFEKSQNIVDLTLNRWSMSQSRAGRIDIWNPQLTVEGQANPNLTLNWGSTYTAINQNVKPEDIIKSVYLDDNKAVDLKQFMELFMQMTMNESGVMNANDGQSAGLESSKLATGIRNIEKSGQEMFGVFLSHLEPGIGDSVGKNARLLLANIDRDEVYKYFEEGEGGEGAGQLMEVSAADIPAVDLDVQILLTRHRGEQMLAVSAQAIETVQAFYAQPFEVQMVTQMFFRDRLRAMEVPNPDKIIVPTQLVTAPDGTPLPNSGVVEKPSRMEGQAA